MMRKTIAVWAAGFFFVVLPASAFQLSGFNSPESAVRDPETGAIFISCVNGGLTERDGNGYISRISASGTIVIQKFIGGKPGVFELDAPKGLALWANKLLVADIDKIRVFDKKTGSLLRAIDLSSLGAVFLNDLVLDPAGVLYVSDTLADKIFSIDLKGDNQIRVFREGSVLGGPNGLAINPRSNNLLVATWRTGSVLEIDHAGRIHILKRGLTNLDGIDFDEQWNLYVSSFSKGEIYKILFLGRGALSVFASNLRSPADISFDRRRRELLVPLMEAGAVESIPQTPKK